MALRVAALLIGYVIVWLCLGVAKGDAQAKPPLSRQVSVSASDAAQPDRHEFPEELVQFQAYDQNPVFAALGQGTWEVRIRERGWIMRENGLYHLWYTGYDGTDSGLRMLGYATSRDGLRWTRHPANPLFKDAWVEDMMVVKQEGAYYMFAEGRGDQAQLLTSPDGIKWTRQGSLAIRYMDGTPLSAGPYGTPTAWFEDGTWYLFYERRDEGVWLAQSRDLHRWTNVRDDPVLSPGPDSYDRDLIALNQIIKHQGRYYAYYHGTSTASSPRRWCTCVAASKDLIHWKKYPRNPLVDENKSSGIVVQDGSKFRLYTMHDQVDVYFAGQ